MTVEMGVGRDVPYSLLQTEGSGNAPFVAGFAGGPESSWLARERTWKTGPVGSLVCYRTQVTDSGLSPSPRENPLCGG